MLTYLVHLKSYFETYVVAHGGDYDRHEAVDYLLEKHWKEYIEPNTKSLIAALRIAEQRGILREVRRKDAPAASGTIV
jgi:hypothetical protein